MTLANISAAHGSGSTLPLHGIRVVEIGNYIAGPGAAMTLGDLGAEVVKIEAMEGDMARHAGHYGNAMLRSFNRSKKSVAIDLRTRDGLQAAVRLIASSDVVIQNLRPGAADRLGLGAKALRKENPSLIYCSITGFPAESPSNARAGYDIAAQAESGLMSLTGDPNGSPQKVGAPIVDTATAQLAAQAVLAALLRKERFGGGETIDISLLEVALHLQLPTWSDYLVRGVQPFRTGEGQPLNAPAADLMQTADGQIVVSAYIESHWQRLCRVLGMPELADDPRFCRNELRVANRSAMKQALSTAFQRLTTDEAINLLADNNIVAGAVRSYSEVLAGPDFSKSRMLIDVDSNEQEAGYQSFGLPYDMLEAGRSRTVAPPEVGADTRSMLAMVGYGEAEIESLARNHIVKIAMPETPVMQET
ncbi:MULTISPECIES: CaiB/BaiF CoA-transferase family protein [Comamonas]|uniref:CaiB/BaiF CoA transferase family protein n=1 Tax=Comamonas TaxID=283 RepID=UPI0015FC68AE|nr:MULTISPECIES: CoA transferase [Comamonas]UUC94816.1 CoA transferase [Comamonas sp. C11]